MKAIYDHFLVVKDQEELDADAARIEEAEKEIKETQQKQKRIITTLETDTKDLSRADAKDRLVISNFVDNRILTVHAVGPDCEQVKPGDRVIVRTSTQPEVTKFNNKFYFSYPERSVSVLLEETDEQ